MEEYGTWLRIGRSEEILQEGIGSFWQKIWRFVIGCKGRGYMKQKSESEDKNWRDCAAHHDFDALISIAAGLVKKRSQVNTATILPRQQQQHNFLAYC